MGATNLPHELDEAVLRRLSKRIYIPLPDATARTALIDRLLPSGGAVNIQLHANDRRNLIQRTDSYSCSDLNALCKEAAMGPVRDLGIGIRNAGPADVRPVNFRDFEDALSRIRPTVTPETLQTFAEWERDNT